MNLIPDKIKGVRLSDNINSDLEKSISAINPDKVFFLFEENTNRLCRPLISLADRQSKALVLKAGEENKSLEQLMKVWDFFEENGAGRSSLLITVGGGMLTDLGGFAACTFKRGMSFVNVPTTLLAMVDASVGGKTGINYRGLKNELGVIRQPFEVLIHTPFLQTLDQDNFLSGFAEMLKAGLIKDKSLWNELVNYSFDNRNSGELRKLIWRSVSIKNSIVEIDPDEKNERRSLNLGHTTAHAFESLSLKKGTHLHHGFAVGYGILVESHLSESICGLNKNEAAEIRRAIHAIYGGLPFTKDDIPELIEYMKSDKKNDTIKINFTLLDKIGSYSINNYLSPDEIREVFTSILP